LIGDHDVTALSSSTLARDGEQGSTRRRLDLGRPRRPHLVEIDKPAAVPRARAGSARIRSALLIPGRLPLVNLTPPTVAAQI